MKPSLTARLFQFVFRTIKPLLGQYNGGPKFRALIAKTRTLKPALPTRKHRKRNAVLSRSLGGYDIWTVAPKDRALAGHLLYFHGGGYIFRAVPPHWNFYAHMAETHGIAVTAPLYPLAPENTVEATLSHAMAAYRDFIAAHDGRFVLGGDSAGGGLAAAVVQAAKTEGLRLPDGLLLICPWLDVRVSHPDQPIIEKRDCILTVRGAREAGEMYAGGLPTSDPRVSPIEGDWAGLPPTLMFGGTDDILLVDARAAKAKLPSADYVEGEGLMHDWPIFFFPESRDAQAKMAAFIA
jgi:epsilon-lactone hydrolase